MEITFLLSITLLILFAILAFFDGVYLHIIKYRLHAIKDTRFEHFTHTIRSILFVGILFTLYININKNSFFYWGIFFVILDLIVLFIDAYVEKDSRKFMGGLPRWEYIIHLFVNGFHFAGIALILVLKINLSPNNIELISNFSKYNYFADFSWLSRNILPGAIFIAILHIMVYIKKVDYFIVKYYYKTVSKLNCC